MQKRKICIFLLALILGLLTYASSVLLMPPKEALAQSFVIGSDPVDGSTINTVPSVVRIYFNATISKLSSAHVYAVNNGQQIDASAAPSHISPTNPRELDISLKTPSELPQGSYEVKWTAISNDDGRTTFGLIGFNNGYSSTGLPGKPLLGPGTSNDLSGIRTLNTLNIFSILWEWLALIALTLWIGTLSIEWLLARSQRTLSLLERTKKQAQSLQWLCLTGLLIADCVNLVLRASHINQALQQKAFDPTTIVQLVLQTNYGWLWIARIVLLVIAMLLLSWQQRIRPSESAPEPAQRKALSGNGPLRQYVTGDLRKVTAASLPRERITINLSKERSKEYSPARASAISRYAWLPIPLAVLYLLAHVISSESTQVLQPQISAIIFECFKLWAQGIWFGGLAYLAYVLLPFILALEHDHHADILAALLQHIIPVIMASIGITFVCSWFLGEISISSLQQLLTDPYGRTLLVQGGLLIVLLVFGLYTFFAMGPRLSRTALLLPVVKADLPTRRARQEALDQRRYRFALITGIQAWLGAGVLLCSALLLFFAPPIVFPAANYNAQQAAPAPASQTTQTQQIGNLSVTMQVVPAKAGVDNTILLTLVGPGGQLVSNARVKLTVNMQAMDMGTVHVTATGGNPTYVATLQKGSAFSMAGLWVINAQINQPGQPPIHGTFKVNV